MKLNKQELLKVSAKGAVVIAGSVVSSQLIGFVTQIFLARFLEPEVFGKVAFATSVAMFLNVFTNLHGDKYVIHQKSDPKHAVNVAFTLELIAALVIFAIVLVLAPLIMDILGKNDLTVYVQCIALSFFYNPFSRIRCLFERNLSFFRSKISLLISQVAAAILGITLALHGYGIWSLVGYRLTTLAGEVVILWLFVSGRPKIRWDTEIARDLFRFSWPLVASAFLTFFYYNIDYLIIGHYLEDGATQLGYYWLGFQAGTYFLMTRQVLYQVLFPIFSRLENDDFKIKFFERITHATGSFFLVLTITLVYFAKDFIWLFYGPQWDAAIIPFRIILIVVLMRAISSNLGYFLYSQGQTLPELKVGAVYAFILPPLTYFMTIKYGINGTAMSVLLVQVIAVVYAFECFVRPFTGYGTLHYFFWPWAVSSVALLLAFLTDYYDVLFSIRIILFLGLIAVAYYTVLKPVFSDMRSALKIISPKKFILGRMNK